MAEPQSDVLDMSVSHLRRKSGAPALLHTVRGVGYRLAFEPARWSWSGSVPAPPVGRSGTRKSTDSSSFLLRVNGVTPVRPGSREQIFLRFVHLPVGRDLCGAGRAPLPSGQRSGSRPCR
ncbi:hypothetical protein ACWDB3_27555 [Streptomyces bacillaris]